jgi:flagellin-like protein
MRKPSWNKKALSPVVASIILIAVTVVVSIAVAAWMGAIPGRYMSQPQLSITDIKFDDTDSNKTIVLKVTNTGTAVGTVAYAKVNEKTETLKGAPVSIQPGKYENITIILTDSWKSGFKYSIKLYSESGELLAAKEETAP